MSTLFRDLRHFVRLPRQRQLRLVAALAAISRVAILLRLHGYGETRRRLEHRSRQRPAPSHALASELTELDAWAVRVAARWLPWGSCLRRSLALWWLLHRRGIESEIHFGGRSVNELEAHAWLEVDGRPLTDVVDPRQRFQVLS